jgi:hypothetical protein
LSLPVAIVVAVAIIVNFVARSVVAIVVVVVSRRVVARRAVAINLCQPLSYPSHSSLPSMVGC